MNEARIGGVQVRVNPDGSLWIYQPDSNRLMGPELAEKLTQYLMLHCLRIDDGPVEVTVASVVQPGDVLTVGDQRIIASAVATMPDEFATVPGGVIAMSDGAVDPEADAAIAALNAGAELEPREWEPGEVEALGGDKVIEPSKPAPRRRGRPPRKA